MRRAENVPVAICTTRTVTVTTKPVSAAVAPTIADSTVLAVTAYVWERGVGAVFRRDAVLITDTGAEVLTASPSPAQAGHGDLIVWPMPPHRGQDDAVTI